METQATDNAPGHVFVVNGSLEHLRCDAVIVPTDLAFRVEPSFWPVFDNRLPADVRPDDWTRARSGEARGYPGVWFLDVARSSVAELTFALDALLVEIADGAGRVDRDNADPEGARARRLVALPTLGVRNGGFRRERGKLINALLESAEAIARSRGVDVALVARGRASFSAFQAARRRRAKDRLDPVALEGSRQRRLGKFIREGRVALFVGAGVSMSAGLPSWATLISSLAEKAGLAGLGTLSALDQAELLSTRLPGGLGPAVAEVLAASNPTGRHGVAHALLAGFRCREVVTTNFDLLLEQAMEEAEGRAPTTLIPSSDVRSDRPWLLKLHGDVNQPKSIVLSRADFVRFAGTSAARGAVLQELMLTRHLLVVGASLTDDNFLRLAHQVMALRGEAEVESLIGTVLTLVPEPARAMLFSREFEFVAVDPGPKRDKQAARALEIELDHIGMYACSDASYLLDADFDALLNRYEQSLAQEARQLVERLDTLDDRRHVDAWRLLREELSRFGAPPAPGSH